MNNKLNEFGVTDLALIIHQAALHPHLDLDALYNNIDMAKHFNFGGICIDLDKIPYARKRLGETSNTKLIGSIAFPFGSIPSSMKKEQAEWAASQGAEELDVVPNFFALHQAKIDVFAEDIANICEIGLPVRIIIDMTNLTLDKLTLAIDAGIDAGVLGIQSSNGFGRPISISDIRQIKKIAKGRCQIKAVGSIKTLENAMSLIDAGADIIGTSVGEQIIKESRKMKE